MGTRSFIGVECEDGIYAIYCHWDGYPEHNGRILAEHYQDFMKVCTLINGGSLSVLREEIGSTQDFDNPNENWCVYYGRDRGETDVGYQVFKSEDEFLKSAKDNWAEYAYLFVNGQWIANKL